MCASALRAGEAGRRSCFWCTQYQDPALANQRAHLTLQQRSELKTRPSLHLSLPLCLSAAGPFRHPRRGDGPRCTSQPCVREGRLGERGAAGLSNGTDDWVILRAESSSRPKQDRPRGSWMACGRAGEDDVR